MTATAREAATRSAGNGAKILYCNCAYSRVVPDDVKTEVLAGLTRSGVAFDAVPDLCELAARGDASLERLVDGEGEIRIAACYPRAVKWLFHRAGSPLPDDLVQIGNMRTESADEVLAGLLPDGEGAGPADGSDDLVTLDDSSESRHVESTEGGWTPWFPVIDYDRCTNCMQCLSFCLFGVYDVDDEKRIEVREPTKCKTHCPACSRVCPEVAILFPKYKAGPINGDQVKSDDVEREKMKTDISSLLGGDIYSLLRERHKRAASRFSKERDEERALKERQRCLKKLQTAFDIPEEVLDQLPSAEQIQARFEERLSRKLDAGKEPTT